MDTPTSAAPDEKTPPLELSLAAQLSKLATQESSKLSGPLEYNAEQIRASVARLTSSSIDELQGLVSELQKMQEFLKSEVDSVQRQIDSALPESILSSKPSVRGKASRPRKHFHTETAPFVGDRRQILSNAVASGSYGWGRSALTGTCCCRRRSGAGLSAARQRVSGVARCPPSASGRAGYTPTQAQLEALAKRMGLG